jgi:uncharacterized protein YdhG (YjbR/CyaY superfamily)
VYLQVKHNIAYDEIPEGGKLLVGTVKVVLGSRKKARPAIRYRKEGVNRHGFYLSIFSIRVSRTQFDPQEDHISCSQRDLQELQADQASSALVHDL